MRLMPSLHGSARTCARASSGRSGIRAKWSNASRAAKRTSMRSIHRRPWRASGSTCSIRRINLGRMSKTFASQSDLAPKKISFSRLSRSCFAFTAEGDPNTGVIVGDDAVMVIDAQATPVMARKVIERIRGVTDKPVKYVVLSHYHAVRVLGASAYGAGEIIASETCRAMIHERGQEDWDSEFGRFPRLFQAAESIPGLTWPTV